MRTPRNTNSERGLQQAPTRAGALPRRVVKRRPHNDSGFPPRLRPGVDKLVTPMGVDESLAFRAFDKTIIFGHWISNTQKLALASGAFLLKKASTLS